jgi:adenylate kinase family enzyme
MRLVLLGPPGSGKKRNATYHDTMVPLMACYSQLGNVKTVDTSGTIDEATKLLLNKIRCHFEDQ